MVSRKDYNILKLFFFIFLQINYSLFAESIPDWVIDKNAIYPSSTYISVLGEGKSKKIAKEDAVSGISKYLKTEINISTKAETKAFSANSKTDYSKTLEEIVTLNSSVILSGIEYTSPYYLKKNKTWYCVAYISRDDAWTQYFPTLSTNLSIFNDFYNKSNVEEDSITKYKLYSHTQVYAENLINSLNYARLLKSENEMLYENDRIKAGSIPSLIEAEKGKFTIYIKVLNDYGSILSSAISEILSDTDFLVISDEKKANYIAYAKIEDNLIGNEPLSISPSIDFSITGKYASIFSIKVNLENKTTSYELKNAQKKAYPQLANMLKQKLENELPKIFE